MKYQVEKNITINSPLNSVRSLVDNFNNWNKWSPWTIVEPNCPIEIQGQSNQAGHSMSWDGKIIGSGKNILRESNDRGLYFDLEFFKPWKSKAQISLLFEERGEQTQVTWTMDSNIPFFLFFMIKMMKNWIGMDYDRGLRMLKEVAEKGKVNCQTTNNDIIDYQGYTYIGIERTASFTEIPQLMKKDFETIVKDVVIERNKGARHWLCLYPKFDMKNMVVTYIAAISDEDLKEIDLGPQYIKGKIKSSRMLEIKHDGAYDFLGNAWSMGMMSMRAKKYKNGGHPFEQYWNSPFEVTPDELKTSIYFPIKG